MRLLFPLIVVMVVGLLLVSIDVSGRSLLVILTAALLAFPAALLGASFVSGARRSDLQTRTLTPWAALFVALVFLTATLVLVLMGPEPWWLAPASGWLVASIVFALSASLWLAPLKPIFRLRGALSDPTRIDGCARDLVASFEAARRPRSGVPLRRHANRALAAVNVLAEAMRFEDAERVLATVSINALDDLRRAAVQASRAMVLLYRHDRDGAWAALKDAASLARDPFLKRAIELLDALGSALDGHGKEALERLGSNVPTDPKLRRSYLIARAHALCALGDTAEARACLGELSELAADGLERVALLEGPASALARDMATPGGDDA